MAVQETERTEDLLSAGRSALKAGDRETAGARFRKAAEISPYDERVWQALLEVVAEPEDEIVCLGNILAINPANKKAKRRMAELKPAPKPARAAAAPAAELVPAPAPAPVATPVEIQAAAEQQFEEQEKAKRARRRRWRSLRSGFGQGLLIGFAGMMIGLVLSVFIYGIGQNGGILDVWFAPIRALYP